MRNINDLGIVRRLRLDMAAKPLLASTKGMVASGLVGLGSALQYITNNIDSGQSFSFAFLSFGASISFLLLSAATTLFVKDKASLEEGPKEKKINNRLIAGSILLFSLLTVFGDTVLQRFSGFIDKLTVKDDVGDCANKAMVGSRAKEIAIGAEGFIEFPSWFSPEETDVFIGGSQISYTKEGFYGRLGMDFQSRIFLRRLTDKLIVKIDKAPDESREYSTPNGLEYFHFILLGKSRRGIKYSDMQLELNIVDPRWDEGKNWEKNVCVVPGRGTTLKVSSLEQGDNWTSPSLAGFEKHYGPYLRLSPAVCADGKGICYKVGPSILVITKSSETPRDERVEVSVGRDFPSGKGFQIVFFGVEKYGLPIHERHTFDFGGM